MKDVTIFPSSSSLPRPAGLGPLRAGLVVPVDFTGKRKPGPRNSAPTIIQVFTIPRYLAVSPKTRSPTAAPMCSPMENKRENRCPVGRRNAVIDVRLRAWPEYSARNFLQNKKLQAQTKNYSTEEALPESRRPPKEHHRITRASKMPRPASTRAN